MKKFTDTIINSTTGLPVSAARVYVRDGSNNLATLYADDGSTPLVTEYAETNALGRFEFYVADGNYKLEYYFNGAVQVTVPDIEIISAENLPRSAATRDAMAALDGATVKATIVVESGHEGTWIWSNANLSAQVTADPTRATYVAPASDPTGATGAWVKNSDTLDADLAASTGAGLIGSTGGITVQAALNARPTSATLAASGGTALVGFLQAGAGAAARTAQAKMRDVVSVKDFGATGDGATDDTAAIHAARDSGATKLFFPVGTYRTTGIVFGSASSVVEIEFAAGAKIYLVSASSRIALDIQKNVFTISGRCEIDGTGTTYDGLATIGIRHGTSSQGCNYLTAEHLIIRDKFSSRCFVSYAFVNITIHRADIYAGSPIGGNPSTCYGISFETGASGCTMAQLGQIYINGGRRGFNGGSVSWFSIDTITVEYSGRGGGNTDGGIHLDGCAVGTIVNIYGEQNERNMVRTDSNVILINNQMFAALTSADVFSYSAVAFADRGGIELTNRSLKVGEILPDSTVDVSVTTGLHIGGSGASQVVNLNASRILTTRKTGWSVDTGTAKRTANATYSGTAEGAYTQATIQTLMDAVRDLSQTVKALKDDLHATAGHGLIGA